MPIRAYAFDAYGTLFDVHSAIHQLRERIGEDADAFSAIWRQKQLEYSWVRTLMGRYKNFWQLTEEALDFALARFPNIETALRTPLLEAYFTLQAYEDVVPALSRLKSTGYQLALFTNGSLAMAQAAAKNSQITTVLDHIVSADEIGQFKTAPEIYLHLANRLALLPNEICLVSSNRWDIAGGAAAGLQSIWVNRIDFPDEYREMKPDRVLKSLAEI